MYILKIYIIYDILCSFTMMYAWIILFICDLEHKHKYIYSPQLIYDILLNIPNLSLEINILYEI